MSAEKRLVILRDQSTRRRAHEAIDAAPDGYAMRLAPATRSLEQSAKFHAICGDPAKQLPYAGKARTLEQWKLLLVSAHAVATKEPTEVVPGLEGEFLNLRESTAAMSVGRMSSLIEYATAYAVQCGVSLSG